MAPPTARSLPACAAVPRLLSGTPGRVIDHISKGSLDLSELQYLVLDEADEMLRMGFAEDVEQIFQQTPETRQVALFSATMPSQIRRMSKQYLNNPAEISVKSKTTTGANTRQRYLQVMGPHKLDALTRILEVEEFDGVIAFVRTKMATEDLADKLKCPRLPGCRHQRRHPAAAARAHRRRAEGRPHRHPRGHRRRGPWP